MSGYLLAGVAALCWTAVLVRLPCLFRRPRSPEQRSFWLALFGLAAALTSQIPPVYLALGELTGVPNIAVPVGHALVLIAAWAATAMLLVSIFPARLGARRANRRLAVLVLGLIAMVVLFNLVPAKTQTFQYVTRYGHQSFVTAYYLIYLALLGFASLDVARLCWRYARLAQRDALRLGLRLVAIAGGIAMLYVGYKGANVINTRFQARLPLGDEATISRSLLVVGTIIVTAGTTVSMWGPRLRLESLFDWSRHHQSYRRLSPLWRDLYAVTPEIALYPPPSPRAETIAVRDLRFKLHRRVIEIRDGGLSLRPFIDAGVTTRARQAAEAAGVRGDELEAVVEAAAMAAGIAAKASGRSALASSPFSSPVADDPSGEVAWLQKVAHAYTHSPVVWAAQHSGGKRNAKAGAR